MNDLTVQKPRFYTYSQNNSGGSFIINEERGITEYVIVEAHSHDDANGRAESIGLYFDGYGDCECCGNRWSEQYSYDSGTEIPEIYGKPASQYEYPGSVAIHYLNGVLEIV